MALRRPMRCETGGRAAAAWGAGSSGVIVAGIAVKVLRHSGEGCCDIWWEGCGDNVREGCAAVVKMMRVVIAVHSGQPVAT